MTRISTIFLQVLIVLFGFAILACMLFEPHLEGRNVNATLFEIYFKDLFLACAYAVSILFFVALYQTYRLVGYIGRGELVSVKSVKALRIIQSCAVTLVVALLVGEAYLFAVQRGKDDIAGGVAMGLCMIFVFTAIATVTALYKRRLEGKLSQ